MVIATLMTVLIHGCVIASLIPLPVPGIFKRNHSKNLKNLKGPLTICRDGKGPVTIPELSLILRRVKWRSGKDEEAAN